MVLRFTNFDVCTSSVCCGGSFSPIFITVGMVGSFLIYVCLCVFVGACVCFSLSVFVNDLLKYNCIHNSVFIIAIVLCLSFLWHSKGLPCKYESQIYSR